MPRPARCWKTQRKAQTQTRASHDLDGGKQWKRSYSRSFMILDRKNRRRQRRLLRKRKAARLIKRSRRAQQAVADHPRQKQEARRSEGQIAPAASRDAMSKSTDRRRRSRRLRDFTFNEGLASANTERISVCRQMPPAETWRCSPTVRTTLSIRLIDPRNNARCRQRPRSRR